ncbi:hypothetical protein BRD00_14080 [Halobacteriales archaeon QS_8_69_26]|nr:MAG: hypothetical protein BRD00_14080 [Halobacteriales archaeon QS_8_69_26]
MSPSPLPDAAPDDGLDVELFCRASTTTASAVDRYANRLEDLREDGVVADIDVTTWPSRIDFSTGQDDLVDACERFEEWAEGEDVTLRPAFDRKEITSEFTGESRRMLVTPVACLAAYDGEDLVAVYPHTDVDRTRTVEDALDGLAATATPSAGSGSASAVEYPDD